MKGVTAEDLAALSEDQRRELLELLVQRDYIERTNRLDTYQPYPKQMEFHALGAIKRERLFMAGNQLGKCATVSSRLELPDGSVRTFGELYAQNRPFAVWGFDEKLGAPVVTTAVTPIKKPAEPCVRLWFQDGSWFEAALRHRVLLATGRYVFVGELLPEVEHGLSGGRPPTSSGSDLSARAEDGPRLSEIPQGFRSSCLWGLRLCDGLLRRVANTALRVETSTGGVQPRTQPLWPSGVPAQPSSTSSRQSGSDHLSSSGGLRRSAARCVASSAASVYRFARRTMSSIQALQQRLVASGIPARSEIEGGHDQSLMPAFGVLGVAGNQIVAYERITSQEVYDFTVPETSNYIANGIVHHNTWSGAFEVAMHVTGRYPAMWTGRRFPRPTRWLVGSESAELTKKGIQRLLLGEPEKREEWGTGAIPKDCIISTSPRAGVPDAVSAIVVRHISGSQSVIQFQSYDQGRTKWQADTVDGVWFDEEPPQDVYFEGLTRTNATGGLVMLTFTPLMGMSAVVKRYLEERPEGTCVVNMTIEHALHYTPAQRRAIIASYPPHERDARARGIPIMGSGLVFPLIQEAIEVVPFALPAHFRRISALDFGWDHPAAYAALAHDADTDTVYVYDAWKEREQTAGQQAIRILQSGYGSIPTAWPHDGLQHDKGSGEQLAGQYKTMGINTLEKRAQFEDGTYGVEAGIGLMLDRFQSKKLRVFSTCIDLFAELRQYHRKDGVIVKLDDDIICAVRYGLMSLRFAKSLTELAPVLEKRANLGRRAPRAGFAVFDPITGY